jgi:mono/diheme cytochrome c family protein
MLRSLVGGVALASIVAVTALTAHPSTAGQGAPSNAGGQPPAPHRAVLNTYCVTCHSDRLRTAGLSLQTLDVARPADAPDVWEKVVGKLRTATMPPVGMPRPSPAAAAALAAHLEASLDRAAAERPNPGRPVLRRLTRTEYRNAVRDLLAVEIDAASLLPADDSRFGFDNVGSVLTLSPLLAERYLAVARHVRRLALGDPAVRPALETYDVSRLLLQDDRAGDDLPFGTRGGIAVRHHFPADGEYVFTIRLQRNSREYIRGLQAAHDLDVRLDGRRVERFTIGGERRGRSAGIFSTAAMGEVAQEQYERRADEELDVRRWVTAGLHHVSAAFVKDGSVVEAPLRQRMTMYDYSQYKGGEPGVATLGIDGPYSVKGVSETASRRRVFVCRPQGADPGEPCARRILTALARSAYRRPVGDDELQTLVGFFRAGQRQGGFEAGIGLALERLLIGPEFLFRVERDPAGTKAGVPYRISDIELASRLSFFLWSSIPDEELLALAERGRLRDRATLERQVRRMLADARASSLTTNFASQWLHLRNLGIAAPDLERYPYFDENLREAFRTETELFFTSILREDRSVLDLLSADYTFLNERLALHYGIPGVYGSHFRRVRLTDGTRGGLLGHGSILTVTSYSNRTSPVVRGKWILDNILNAPPPPPPPNIPELQARDARGKVLSMRAQMEQHRSNPVCAGCHRVMDPLGFALENFDGVGRWRTTDATASIDASGAMPDGTTFSGPAEFRRVLLDERRDQFVSTVADRLLTYALGRGLEAHDAPSIRRIVRDAAPGGYTWSAIVLGVATSTPFQMRRADER